MKKRDAKAQPPDDHGGMKSNVPVGFAQQGGSGPFPSAWSPRGREQPRPTGGSRWAPLQPSQLLLPRPTLPTSPGSEGSDASQTLPGTVERGEEESGRGSPTPAFPPHQTRFYLSWETSGKILFGGRKYDKIDDKDPCQQLLSAQAGCGAHGQRLYFLLTKSYP